MAIARGIVIDEKVMGRVIMAALKVIDYDIWKELVSEAEYDVDDGARSIEEAVQQAMSELRRQEHIQ